MKNRRVKLQKKQTKSDENVYIELDTKCSCSPTSNSDQASIQFTRRYLECQGSMPIHVIRIYIEQILPHSPMTQVSIYDENDRLLDDSTRLNELLSSCSSSYIPLRFTMINTVTLFGHCLCSSPSLPTNIGSSFSPKLIERETINRTLSTCPLVPTPPQSPLSTKSISPSQSTNNPMSVVNLLTPPSPPNYSSFLIDTIVESKPMDSKLVDKITSEFGEICPSLPLSKPKRQRLFKKTIPKSLSPDIPLDLTMKKRSSSSFDLFSAQSKWLKMI